MYQSQTKHKVVTKNLDDILKQSTFSTKRNSIDDLVRCQRHLKTQPRLKNSLDKNKKCNTIENNQQNEIKRLKNNTLMSKHSLQSKEKVNFLDLSQLQIKSNNHCINKKSKNFNSKFQSQNFLTNNKKDIKDEQNFTKNNMMINHQVQSVYFNQIDAIFTELEDFLRETRQMVLIKIENQNSVNVQDSNDMVDEMDELFIVFKQQVQRLVEKYSQCQTDCRPLKPDNKIQKSRKLIRFNENQFPEMHKQTISINLGNKKFSETEKYDNIKNTKQKSFNEDKMSKLESYIQNQNNVHSIMMFDNQENQQFPQPLTQNDAQLLSILVLKNKLSKTKRKNQNNSVQYPTIMGKSGQFIKQNCEGEYSFRNKHLFDITNNSQNKNHFIMKKNKSQKKQSSERGNKENREKSIYQMVLEEKKRLKTSIYK